MATKNSYKYGDFVPMSVHELTTLDGDITFKRAAGKTWLVAKSRGLSPERRVFQNEGDLLWEWGQTSHLRDTTDVYQAAVDYFHDQFGSVAIEDPEHLFIPRDAKKHIHAIIAHIQQQPK